MHFELMLSWLFRNHMSCFDPKFYLEVIYYIYIHIYIYIYIHTCLLLISMLWHRQAIFESKGDKLSSSAEGRIRTQDLRYLFTSRLNACWQTDWAIEDQAKKLELDSPWIRAKKRNSNDVPVAALAGFIAVREMSGRNKISQGQGIVREFYKVSGKFWHLAKLMKKVMKFHMMSGKMTILDSMSL